MGDKEQERTPSPEQPAPDETPDGALFDQSDWDDAGDPDEATPPADTPADEPEDDTPPADEPPADESQADTPEDKPKDDAEPEDEAVKLAKEREQEAAQQAEQAQAARKWRVQVESLHPDYEDVLADPQYAAWFEANRDNIGDLAKDAEEDAASAIAIFNRFKRDRDAGNIPRAASETQQAPSAATIDQFIEQSGLADKKYKDADGKEVSFKQLMEEAGPEIYQSFVDMLQASTAQIQQSFQRQLQQALQSAGYARQDDIKDLRSKVRDAEIAREHSDYHTVASSEAFNKFLENDDEPLRELWTHGDARGRIAYLNHYKQSIAKTEGDKARDTQRKKRDARRDLHSETLRGGESERERVAAGDDDRSDMEAYREDWDKVEVTD